MSSRETSTREGSPCNVPKGAKWNRRRRRSSQDFLSVEEITSDDIGYDGDIDPVKPDEYEDAESETNNSPQLQALGVDSDDELASRMKELGHDYPKGEHETSHSQSQGRKRQSKEMDLGAPGDHSVLGPETTIEVSELRDEDKDQHTPKRRRKRDRRLVAAQHLMKGWSEAFTDSSERADDSNLGFLSSSRSETPLGILTRNDHDAMDLE